MLFLLAKKTGFSLPIRIENCVKCDCNRGVFNCFLVQKAKNVMQQTATEMQELVPLLYVDDIVHSSTFYCDGLGFEQKLTWEPDGKLAWCRLERGNAAIMLQLAVPEEDGAVEERCKGVGFFFLCDDAQAMYEELLSRGLTLEPPKVAFYGMNQLFLKDPDGYELCFQNQVEIPTVE